jgi:hypothetical protein
MTERQGQGRGWYSMWGWRWDSGRGRELGVPVPGQFGIKKTKHNTTQHSTIQYNTIHHNTKRRI